MEQIDDLCDQARQLDEKRAMTLQQEIALGNYLGNLLWSIPSCRHCGKATFTRGRVGEKANPKDYIIVPLCEDCRYKLDDQS